MSEPLLLQPGDVLLSAAQANEIRQALDNARWWMAALGHTTDDVFVAVMTEVDHALDLLDGEAGR